MNRIDDATYTRIKSILPILCVDCIVLNSDQEVLLLKRLRNPEKNKFWFPGGRVRIGEQPKEASERKILEEASLRCKYLHTVGIESTIFNDDDTGSVYSHTYNILCRLEIDEPEPVIRLNDDHSEYGWFSAQEIDLIATSLHPSVLRVIKMCWEPINVFHSNV